MSVTIGIDVGGTKIAGGVVTESGDPVEVQRVETPARDADATKDAIVGLIKELQSRHRPWRSGELPVRRRRPLEVLSRPTSRGATSRRVTRSRPRSASRSSSRTTSTRAAWGESGSVPARTSTTCSWSRSARASAAASWSAVSSCVGRSVSLPRSGTCASCRKGRCAAVVATAAGKYASGRARTRGKVACGRGLVDAPAGEDPANIDGP